MRRRRECLSCGVRFTTFETAELVMPQVVKNDSTRQSFDEGKLRGGIMKALEKRPVGRDAVEAAIERIGHRLRVLGEREVPSRVIGEIVMEELRHLDEVAYALRLGVSPLPRRRLVPRRARAARQAKAQRPGGGPDVVAAVPVA